MEKRFEEWEADAKQIDSLVGVTSSLLDLDTLLGDVANAEARLSSSQASVDLAEWRTEGHEWIGKRLRRSCTYIHTRVVNVAVSETNWPHDSARLATR